MNFRETNSPHTTAMTHDVAIGQTDHPFFYLPLTDYKNPRVESTVFQPDCICTSYCLSTPCIEMVAIAKAGPV